MLERMTQWIAAIVIIAYFRIAAKMLGGNRE